MQYIKVYIRDLLELTFSKIQLTIIRKWIGHMLRGDSLLRTIIKGKMEGKKTRGRPR